MSFVAFAFCFLFSACSEPVDIEGFDSEAWKKDILACGGERIKMQQDVLSIREELEGLSPRQVISVLGRPNKEELYKRSQKFFVYYLTPGQQCKTSQDSAKYLFIRFSALNMANEVFIND